jgi:hypothetical protein
VRVEAERIEADRLTFDSGEGARCICVHESIATSIGLTDGPSNQCENVTTHPSGRCHDCRYGMRTVDGGGLVFGDMERYFA